MTETNDGRSGWAVSVSGEASDPSQDKLTLIHRGSPQVFLDIVVPGLRSAGEDQRVQGRRAIQEVVNALQAALDSPLALAGFRPQ